MQTLSKNLPIQEPDALMKNIPKNHGIESGIIDLIGHTLGHCQISPVMKGASGAKLFKLTSPDKNTYYLKIIDKDTGKESLLYDKLIYEWLLGKVKVPKVVFYQNTATYEVLCTEEVEGDTLEGLLGKIPNKDIVQLFAKSLKTLHTIPIEGCNIIRSLESRLEAAQIRVQNKWVAPDEFEEQHKNYSPGQLFQRLLSEKPRSVELVFTHGDYCLDNILVKDGQLSGFIDIGRGGVADKYQDIALAIRSIQHELGNEWIEQFCKEYGIEKLDEKKMHFYLLLDEFF